jgi:hypothetical protein
MSSGYVHVCVHGTVFVMPTEHRHAEHLCEVGCGQWGAFGFAPDPLLPKAERVTRWYCGTHRGIGAAEMARWKARAGDPAKQAPPVVPGTGRLL